MAFLAQPDDVEHGVGFVQRGARLQSSAGPAEERAHRGVLANRHRGERPHDLEGAPDPQPRDPVGSQAADRGILPADLAGVRAIEPADAVEQGGLAGAVRSDDAQDITLLDLEGDAGEGVDATETLAEVAYGEQAHCPHPDPPPQAGEGSTSLMRWSRARSAGNIGARACFDRRRSRSRRAE